MEPLNSKFQISNTFLIILFAVLAFTVLAQSYFPRVFLFIILVAIGLLSKYPKVMVAVSFLIVDMTDFMVVLIYYLLGPLFALASVFIFSFGYWSIGMIGCEGPADGSSRLFGLLTALIILNFVLSGSAMSVYNIMVLFIFISGFVWFLVLWFIYHIPNPVYFPIGLVKTILYWNLLQYAFPYLGLG